MKEKSSSLHFGAVSFSRVRLYFDCEKAYVDSSFRGSAWRGVLGGALKRLVCVTREKECSRCILYRCCVYPYVLETPPPAEEAQRFTAVPHPFVLDVPVPSGERRNQMVLGVTMFGVGERYLPYVIRALEQAADRGLRPENIRMRLGRVEQERIAGTGEWEDILDGDGTLRVFAGTSPTVPATPQRVRLHLRTPMRLRLLNDLLTPERFTPAELGIAVQRRLTVLAKYHGDGGVDERLGDTLADSRWLDARIRWKEWTRFSSRQETTMQMGGLMGEAVLEVGGLESAWPWLWAGQFAHAGKATSMGLGRYEIEPL